MYRPAASRLRALKGQTSRFASSSALASGSSSSVGLFSWLTGERSTPLPSLEFPLPGVTLAPPLPDYVETGKTKTTTLPNGVKIASETAPSPLASIGLYVDCGSVYETPDSTGATHLLERMAFKSTTNRSHLRIVREMEAIGCNMTASGTREQMGYTFDGMKTFVPQMVELLVDSVRNPVFLDWEVDEQLQKVKAEIAEFRYNPEGNLMEALHTAGYAGALGNPLMVTKSEIDRLNNRILEEFVAENYTAPRLVLAASGVDHEKLLSIAEPLLSDLPAVPRPQQPKSQYIGGNYCWQTNSPTTNIALAFEIRGGWQSENDAIILTVLQMLMGDCGAFTVGGPGKGLTARLYRRILNEYYPKIQSFSAFNTIYNNSGLFGIHVTTKHEFIPQAIELAARELKEVAEPGSVTQEELDRAKQATKSTVLMNLESRVIASEDIGRQVLTYGERKPVDYFLKAVDAVTLKDISDLAEEIMSFPLTMASHGDVGKVTCYDEVQGMF